MAMQARVWPSDEDDCSFPIAGHRRHWSTDGTEESINGIGYSASGSSCAREPELAYRDQVTLHCQLLGGSAAAATRLTPGSIIRWTLRLNLRVQQKVNSFFTFFLTY